MTNNAKNLVSDEMVEAFSRIWYGEKFPLPKKGAEKIRRTLQEIAPMLAQAGDAVSDRPKFALSQEFVDRIQSEQSYDSPDVIGADISHCSPIMQVLENYFDEYEFRFDDGVYTPNADERMLIKDAVYGLIEDEDFLRVITLKCPRCAECSEYLKEGETPLQRMDRDKRDSQALLSLLVEARKSIIPDELKQAIRAIIAAVWNTDIRVSHSTHIDTLRRWQKDYTTPPHDDGKVARDANSKACFFARAYFAKGVVLAG
jgi:hypothetical protein